MKTLHINYEDSSGRIYCHKLNDLVKLNTKHFDKQCSTCPYFRDTASMRGVECEFDDASEVDVIDFDDASLSEQHSQYASVRLGIETEQQVNNRLKGMGGDIPIDELYPDDDIIPEGAVMVLDEEGNDVENLEVSPVNPGNETELT